MRVVRFFMHNPDSSWLIIEWIYVRIILSVPSIDIVWKE